MSTPAQNSVPILNNMNMDSMMQGAFSIKIFEIMNDTATKFMSTGEISWATVTCIILYYARDNIKSFFTNVFGKLNTLTNSIISAIPEYATMLFAWLYTNILLTTVLPNLNFSFWNEKAEPDLKKEENLEFVRAKEEFEKNELEEDQVEEEIEEDDEYEKFDNKTLSFVIKNIPLNTIACLVDYAKKVSDSEYTETIIEQVCNGLTNYTTRKQYTISKLTLPGDIECNIKTSFGISYKEGIGIEASPTELQLYKNKKKKTITSPQIKKNELTPILEVLCKSSPKLRSVLHLFSEELVDFYSEIEAMYTKTNDGAGSASSFIMKGNRTLVSINDLATAILTSYPKLQNNQKTRIWITVILSIFYGMAGSGGISIRNCILAVKLPMYDSSNQHSEVANVSLDESSYSSSMSKDMDLYINPWQSALTSFRRIFGSYYDSIYAEHNALFIKKINTDGNEDDKEKEKMVITDSFQVVLKSESAHIKKDNLYQMWTQFVNGLVVERNTTCKKNEKVQNFSLSIVYETKIEVSDNPEYQIYLNKKKQLKELIDNREAKNNNDEIEIEKEIDDVTNNTKDKETKKETIKNKKKKNGGVKGFTYDPHISKLEYEMNYNVPPEKIQTEKKIPKIVAKEISEFVKPLETLYLSEYDEDNLKERLFNFKNCDKLYERLALPKKLNGLLYGAPGLGKTSALKAIATYLEYNIYYVSFNGIVKNSEFDMIFDYVYNQCNKKGMIILEDVDAHYVVHDRSIKNMSITNALNAVNDNLDLAYILNRLDGTQTINGQVVFMTTNHKEVLDPAIYRPGRMDIDIELKKCDHYQITRIFYTIMCRNIDEDILRKIPIHHFSPAQVIYAILPYVNKKKMTDKDIMRAFIQQLNIMPDDIGGRVTLKQKNKEEYDDSVSRSSKDVIII